MTNPLWCPYRNIALRSLQRRHEAITARGAHLVAVSPQVPDESLSPAAKHDLLFGVLSDVGSDVAGQYGLAFDLPDDLAVVYDGLGFDLRRVNAGRPHCRIRRGGRLSGDLEVAVGEGEGTRS